MAKKFIRWHVMIDYRTEHGPKRSQHDLFEFTELLAIVEHGPHWDCIDDIHIVREPLPGYEALTLEQAQAM